MNTFGTLFQITSFGESHGPVIGGVIDGIPSGIPVDMDFLQREMARRSPGQSDITSKRKETDKVEILSGVFEGFTTGCPIGFIVRNSNAVSKDYDDMRNILRPSHADFTYLMKYGIRDHRGGGRASARETVTRCVAGAFAKMVLNRVGICVKAYTSQIGNVLLEQDYSHYDLDLAEKNAVRCPDTDKAAEMESLIRKTKKEHDTIGGIVSGVISGTPAGLGEPVFDKLQAALASAMFSINAVKGFEYGSGFAGCCQKGSEQNDVFISDGMGGFTTRTNNSGGIQGGISNGQDITFRVAFKPVPTLMKEQETMTTEGNNVTFRAKGRHDPCVVPRAVPIVEAMAAITILDFYLLHCARKNIE